MKIFAGLRDIIDHAYFTINAQIVWAIITTKIDPFYEAIQLILKKES
ncbi:MAG: HepT-like ribonuclease domain-containing protein [Microcystaceae cyanobacterium]